MNHLTQNVWPLANLKSEIGKDGRPFHIFLDNDAMTAELYQLPAGSVDMQSPHDLDEMYFIISGRAKFTADGVESNVKAGDSIFVKAKIGHRFHDITEDLSVLVYFSKKEPTL
ncbi:MAG: cupin domain-containing protein [Alphaproteobacteria bacterium]